MSEAENPLLDVGANGPRLPFDRVRADLVVPAIDTLLARAREAVAAVANGAPSTYDAALGALDRATEPLSRAMGLVSHLESVVTTPELRAVVNEVKPRVSEFYASIPLDPALWKALRDYAQTPDAAALTGPRKRHLDKTLDELRRAGAELPEEGKKRLLAIDVELTRITQRYSENVLDATNAWELVIEDEAKLAGLPPSAIAGARAAAQAKGIEKGWRFTLQAPSVIGVLTYLDDAAIRETVWRAYNTRASQGEHDNTALVLQILALRREKATLLGKRDFADLVLEDRMAKDGASAARFVADLEGRTKKAFAKEQEDLLAFRRELEGPQARALEPWDVAYYTEKLRIARYDFDEEALRPYFAADRVLEGLFALAGALYGVTFAPIDLPTWDPSVRVFAIRDRQASEDTLLGVFHVDLFPRESKRGGAWMNSLVMGGPREGGGFDPHVGLFCANATPPIPAGVVREREPDAIASAGSAGTPAEIDGKPALLTHDEVETLFHEFGHLLHQLLSNVEVRALAGTNVAWDFVELPSQIMENWTWERAALDLFARHVDTNETIPEELFTKMSRARTFRAASMQMRQLGFASLDLALHREYDPSKDGPLLAYARAKLAPYSAAPVPSDYALVTSFTHLFASPVGYAAGYYSYKWAEVLDADAFTRFREGSRLLPMEKCREVGRAFREKLLSRGDSDDPMKLFVDFVGRPPKVDALLERSGLA